jgi:hypothetical protein
MRVSENRYTRDLRRIHLAERMIRHEVRTQSICAWTGISDERVRNLCRSYDGNWTGAPRHRGHAPKVFTAIMRTSLMRCEASAIAGLVRALRLIPDEPVPNARKTLPSVELGERLCHAFELYKLVVPTAKLSMDQLILLVLTLAEGAELEVGHCSRCHAALLLDRLGGGRRLCETCKREGNSDDRKLARRIARDVLEPDDPASRGVGGRGDQQSLF